MAKELIFGMVGGLALLIYGIRLMGDGLQKAAGDKMRNLLKALTTNPLMGTIVGAGVTSIVQSSSATTVMTVGFVSAGLMTLKQAIGVVLGANIGTTITAQLIAFKLTHYALPILGVGFWIHFFAKKRFWKYFGLFMLGFGILFLGLDIMSSVVKPMGNSEAARNIFVNFSNNPILGIITGMLVTFVVQSSSVTVGLVLTLATIGLIDLRAAIPLILGDNIGTCITAVLASIGGSISAKRTAAAHIMFNVVGAIIVLLMLPIYMKFIVGTSSDIARQCANAHSIFNIMNTIIFLPFVALYAKLITRIIPGKEIEIEHGPKYLERHLLNTPHIALDAATKEAARMADIARDMVANASKGFFNKDPMALKYVGRQEEVLDDLQKSVSGYLVELSQRDLSEEQAKKIPALLHSVNDIERVGDHAENLVELADRKNSENLPFSDFALGELKNMYAEVDSMLGNAKSALETNRPQQARELFKNEDRINMWTDEFRRNHIKRLGEGKCKVMSGIVFLDMVSNYEKIGDHLTNIAQAVTGDLQWDRKEPAGMGA